MLTSNILAKFMLRMIRCKRSFLLTREAAPGLDWTRGCLIFYMLFYSDGTEAGGGGVLLALIGIMLFHVGMKMV